MENQHSLYLPLPARIQAPGFPPPPQTSSTRAPVSAPLRPPQTPVSLGFVKSPPGAPKKLTPQKRRHPHDENALPTFSPSPTRPSPAKKKRASPKSWAQKLDVVFDTLKTLKWSISDLLFYLFRLRDEQNANIHRSHRHAAAVQQFLRGRTRINPSFIVDVWLRSADGRLADGADEHRLMYSTTVDYKSIKPVRPALTSFAVQLARSRLCRESRDALRVPSASRKEHLEWGDIGSGTVAGASALIQDDQPLLWNFMTSYAVGKPISSNEDIPESSRRPVQGVCTHLISTMNYVTAPRSLKSTLVPTLRGLLYFASSVPYDIFGFSSRIAHTPSYSTMFRILQSLSEHEAKVTSEAGRDPTKWGILRMDNVQNYLLQRDPRIGRENTMNIGIAATYFEADDVNPKAYDLADKRRLLALNQRQNVQVYDFVSWMDLDHFDTVLSLQWLRVLADYIPELHKLKEHVSLLYRTRAAKIPLPVKPTKIHPLATSSKNENVTTELKDALVDFFGQIGQLHGDYSQRLLLVGGDGLTYERHLQLKKYLQFHDDAFESCEFIETALEWWHLGWTDLSRICETHWGDPLTRDPSTLGHSATKIGRRTPSNLKKVDYYPSAELVYTTLDIRILDCWRVYFRTEDIFKHFQQLATQGELPDYADLEKIARLLFKTYSSASGIHSAFQDAEDISEWGSAIPLGTPWSTDPDSVLVAKAVAVKKVEITRKVRAGNTGEGKSKGAQKPKVQARPLDAPPVPFKGDRVLAQSIAFMRDALVSREMAYAVAEGDVGRVYEMIKHMLFTFAGSSHSKYTTYLLETICNLELESTPELRLEILKQSLVNMTGRAGTFCASDFLQEYLNRMLEAIVERKGTDYGDKYVREVVARNLHHFARIKLEVRQGEGLAQRSGRHTAPHMKAEVRTLLAEYQRRELHLRRPGRSYTGPDDIFHADDFKKGFNSLQSGRLSNWATETVYHRSVRRTDNVHSTSGPQAPDREVLDNSSNELDISDNETSVQGPAEPLQLAFVTMVDGDMLLTEADPIGAVTEMDFGGAGLGHDEEGLMGMVIDHEGSNFDGYCDVDTQSDGEE
ncbi:hypothetical protein HYDPIDRAFT_111412 [Hydnomerulius pinastri MD-312]|uniref:DUF6589 domain-containing protein n=1 Tax=Hydnomerulius pinastri MD-312 TaxID=994086 RepID=A0A0C9WFG5_9AGAM|nr:hypothetical protein HYDPIDRAFT_111412 [Hydnomerulius pinastri MD-312]